MPAIKMTTENINLSMETLSGWKFLNEGIEKDFVFKNFNEAFGFLTRIAMLSEKMDHHAECSGVYNKVHLRLSTHDAGGVTIKDLDMAKEIEKYL